MSASFDNDTLATLVRRPLEVPLHVKELLRAAAAKYVEDNGREPPVEVMRRFQSSVYALYQVDLGDEEGPPC